MHRYTQILRPAIAGLCILASYAPSQAESGPGDRGTALYLQHCAACHGAQGDGQGPGAYILAQRPRNFTLGVFKFRSTPSGAPPTDGDLLRTITQGLSGATGSMMPSFAALPLEDRQALVGVVKRFADINAPAPAPIVVPPEPRKQDLALGAEVYKRLQCANCHGADGRGDGPSSTTLRDDDKRRIWAPDLTRGRYKRGETPRDVYLSFATGIDGTPMPSYASKATSNELWALTQYVRSLVPSGGTGPQAVSPKRP